MPPTCHQSSPLYTVMKLWQNRQQWFHDCWDQFIWDHGIWVSIHFRPWSLETTFIWDHGIWDSIHFRPWSLETTFIWDNIHFGHDHLRSHLFYAASKWSCFDLLWITFLWSTFHFFAGDLMYCKATLHLKFCQVTPFRVQGDSRWIVKSLALQNTADARKLFIPRVWKGAFQTKSNNYVLRSFPFPLSKRRNIFSFLVRNDRRVPRERDLRSMGISNLKWTGLNSTSLKSIRSQMNESQTNRSQRKWSQLSAHRQQCITSQSNSCFMNKQHISLTHTRFISLKLRTPSLKKFVKNQLKPRTASA